MKTNSPYMQGWEAGDSYFLNLMEGGISNMPDGSALCELLFKMAGNDPIANEKLRGFDDRMSSAISNMQKNIRGY